MDRLKALPPWAKWTLGVLATLIVIGAVGGGAKNPSDTRSAPTDAKSAYAPIDDTTLYNSVAHVFIDRYNRVTKGSASRLSGDSPSHCDDDHPPVHSCTMRIDVPIVGDESWSYDATMSGGDCWVARTSDRYGANQEVIDSYRNRELFAPTKAEVRTYIHEANRLRSIRGCASNVPRPRSDDSPEDFIAALAAQNVQRERPGPREGTTCDSLGKQVVSLAPDSWDFACTTKMAAGGAFVDKISCFDEPPYSSFDSCAEEQGYPKRPPRALPE